MKQTLMDAAAEARLSELEARVAALESAPKRGRKPKEEAPVAAEDPAPVEEPAVEEPTVEEPTVEEPVAEEDPGVATEPEAEAPAEPVAE